MRDLKEYSLIYQLRNRTILVRKSDCHYSVLLEEDDAYTEVIVSSEEMNEALDFPAAEEVTWVERFRLLFGNYNGFDYFITFCDDNDVSTRTYVWPK